MAKTDTSKARSKSLEKRRQQPPERMRRFVELMKATGKATESARLAGYASPNVKAFTLLKHPWVMAQLQKSSEQTKTGLHVHRDEQLEILAGMIRDAGLEPRDRLKAMELRSRMHGELITKVDARVQQTPPEQMSSADIELERAKIAALERGEA